MSVIQNIRTKYAKLAGFVIAFALVAFILMDALSSRVGSIFGNDSNVAKVNGHKIEYKDYSQRSSDYDILYGYSSQGKTLDDNARAQLNQQALSDLINETLIKEEAEQLGLQTTKDEAKDLIYGANPDPAVRNYAPFRNPETNMFDPQYVRAFEEQVDQYDPTGKARQQWEILKAYVIRNNIVQKYNALLVNSLYVPNFVVERQVQNQGQKASIDYVNVAYANVADDKVEVTDADMEAYMKEHKKIYATEADSRSIEYVSFDVLPTAADTAAAKLPLVQLADEFRNTNDAETFVNRNSDAAYNAGFVMKKDYMSLYTDSIMSLPVGGVFGPYLENSEYKLTKVLDRKTYPDTVVCRHILIKTAQGNNLILPDSIAERKIDSAIAAIKGGAKFEDLVQSVSEDEGSKATNGEYTFDFQQKANISKEFGDFIFEDGKPGQSKKVKVQNGSYSGYHYIEIIKQKNFLPAAKLATITKGLFASDETENNVYAEASNFAGTKNTAAAFDEATQNSLNKRVAEEVKVNDFIVSGLGSAREVIRWMYSAKVGDVSSVFSLKGRYVVAKLKSVNKKGQVMLTQSNRPELEDIVRKKKKKDILIEQFNGKNSLEQVAATANTQVSSADSFSAATSFIPELGFEPKVSGYAFNKGFNKGTLSAAIPGQNGLFYITLKDRFTQESTVDSNMVNRQKVMIQNQLKNGVSSRLADVLKESADIEYNANNL
ncbi:MAG: peptidylprolyl isomerase [Flavipsychrobacter sp.]